MQSHARDNRVWHVTLVYEGGPREGERDEPLLQCHPEALLCWALGPRDPRGRQWGYGVNTRRIDPASLTGVIRVRWQILDHRARR